MLSSLRRPQTWYTSLVALVLTLVIMLGAIAPALTETAGQRSTRNIILGAVALTTAIILYNNYHHKQVAHDTVVGRTADGGVLYADGRIVYPDGTVVYTSSNGRTVCNYAGYGEQCGRVVRAYDWRYEGENEWHGRGLHKGWYKHHDDHHGDDHGGG